MSEKSKRKKVGFIHTTPTTIELAEKCMKLYLPGIELIHI